MKSLAEHNKYARDWHSKKMASDPSYVQRRKDLAKKYRNKSEYTIYQKSFREQNWGFLKLASWARELRRNFNITPIVYFMLLDSQGGGCAICGGCDSTGRKLAVDHCHKTGKIRGLLCTRCNTSLGVFGDSVEGLRKTLSYLTNATEGLE